MFANRDSCYVVIRAYRGFESPELLCDDGRWRSFNQSPKIISSSNRDLEETLRMAEQLGLGLYNVYVFTAMVLYSLTVGSALLVPRLSVSILKFNILVNGQCIDDRRQMGTRKLTAVLDKQDEK
ncbi:MAG: hypothetical protein F6K16_42930 [Symploca sp. SIO2B6]|nr:hypothetical protein [Symploca sp. SIO2B6]